MYAVNVYMPLTFHLCSMQSAEQQKQYQESQAARLADLELLLSTLAAKTEVCTADPLLYSYWENILKTCVQRNAECMGKCCLLTFQLF